MNANIFGVGKPEFTHKVWWYGSLRTPCFLTEGSRGVAECSVVSFRKLMHRLPIYKTKFTN